jgi:hypothetical protein
MQPSSDLHTMDDFLNIFGSTATPALSPSRQDGRAGLLQQPLPPLVTMPLDTTIPSNDMFDGLGFDDVSILPIMLIRQPSNSGLQTCSTSRIPRSTHGTRYPIS